MEFSPSFSGCMARAWEAAACRLQEADALQGAGNLVAGCGGDWKKLKQAIASDNAPSF